MDATNITYEQLTATLLRPFFSDPVVVGKTELADAPKMAAAKAIACALNATKAGVIRIAASGREPVRDTRHHVEAFIDGTPELQRLLVKQVGDNFYLHGDLVIEISDNPHKLMGTTLAVITLAEDARASGEIDVLHFARGFMYGLNRYIAGALGEHSREQLLKVIKLLFPGEGDPEVVLQDIAKQLELRRQADDATIGQRYFGGNVEGVPNAYTPAEPKPEPTHTSQAEELEGCERRETRNDRQPPKPEVIRGRYGHRFTRRSD